MEKLSVEDFYSVSIDGVGYVWGGKASGCECYTLKNITTTPELCNDISFECDDEVREPSV